ncbi:hypothetical protein BS17DRAFT_671635, partial [Gyrodon lividus]
LIDSGAEESCINWGFARKHKLPTERLPEPIRLINVDGNENVHGMVKFTTSLFIKLGEITQKVRFLVMNCGKENIILGLPWLKATNPAINWK